MLPQCSSTKTWFLTLITNYFQFQASHQKPLTFGLAAAFTSHLHPIYTPFAPHLHPIYTTFAPHLHPIYTTFAPHCTPFASHLHPICTPFTSHLHPIYIPFTSHLHGHCIPLHPTRGFNGFVNIPESCDFRLKFDPLNIICKPFFLNTFLSADSQWYGTPWYFWLTIEDRELSEYILNLV